MRSTTAYGSAIVAVVRRDAALYVSYRMAFIAQCCSLVFTVTIFYYVSRLIRVDTFREPDAYFQFVVVGLVIMQAVTGTLSQLPVGVRQELVAGTFERLVLSPFGAVAAVLSMLIFPFLRAALFGLIMILFAIVAFGMGLNGTQSLLALPVAVLGAAAFTPFALLLTAAIFAFKQAPGAGMLMAMITLVAGLYFPVELLPAWIEWASHVQPFTPTVDLMRHLLVGTDLEDPAWREVTLLVCFAVALLPAGVFAMVAALRFGQRRGTVTEF